MATTVGPSVGLRLVLAGAYGATGGAASAGATVPIGTEHLVVGLTVRRRGPADRVLAEFDITLVTAVAAVRAGAWTVDDDDPAVVDVGDLGGFAWANEKRRVPQRYTGAARVALARAVARAAADGRTEADAEDLLAALLEAEVANRAGELLARCGTAPEDVYRRLAGGPPPERATRPGLRRTRDALLGRAPYRVRSFPGRLAYGFVRGVGGNLARTPVPWITLDARDQAQRLGHRKVGTAHVLLAVLATYEVTRDLPFLVGDAQDRYAGARALDDAGVTYARAHAVVAAEPPERDPERYRSYVDRHADTTAVVAAILDGDTAASHVLRRLGVDPAAIR